MEAQFLKQEILDTIMREALLFGKVADAIPVSPTSLPRMIYSRNKKLTQAGVLKVLCEHLKIENSEDLLGPELIREDKLTTVS